MQPIKYQPPNLAELHAGKEITSEELTYLKFINQPTPAFLVKLNKMNKNKPYVPIENVKWMMTAIYHSDWHVEIKNCFVALQSIVTIVRVHYKEGEVWKWQDGQGAAPLQTDTGAAAADLSKIKDQAVQIAAPSSESYAIKDACDKIGAIFGDSLKDILAFAPFEPDEQPAQPMAPSYPQQAQIVQHESVYPGWLWDGAQWVPDPAYQQVGQQPAQLSNQLKF